MTIKESLGAGVVYVLNCDILLSDFKLHLHSLKTNALGKSINPLITPWSDALNNTTCYI